MVSGFFVSFSGTNEGETEKKTVWKYLFAALAVGTVFVVLKEEAGRDPPQMRRMGGITRTRHEKVSFSCENGAFSSKPRARTPEA